MPAEIRGGPSRGHRLPNQADADAAEQALNRNLPPPSRKPLPPPAPLPRGFEPGADVQVEAYRMEQETLRNSPAALARREGLAGALIGGPQPLPQTEDEEAPAPPVDGGFRVVYEADEVQVSLWHGDRFYVATGASLTEALSLAAGKLEEGLALPRCPTCGQVLPEQDE